MTWLKRISLFLLTNMLVLVTVSVFLFILQGFFGIRIQPSQASGLLVWCFVWGMGGAFVSLQLSRWIAKRSMGVRLIDPQTNDASARDILHLVYQLATRAGLKVMPEVGVYDSPDINAFATGPSKKRSLVAISTGLLTRMNRDEIEGVIGHEITHVSNGDMVTMTLITGVVNAFVMFFARILANIIASQVDRRNSTIVYFGLSMLFDIVFGILGSIVVAVFSRAREYRADAGGAELAGKEKMIAGLRKLQSFYDQSSATNSSPLASLQISHRPTGILALMSTHPPLEDRIRRLERQGTFQPR